MQDKTELSCAICGENSYSWGFVQSEDHLKYKGDDAGFWEKHTNLGGEPIKARKCNSCGNIQLFVQLT